MSAYRVMKVYIFMLVLMNLCLSASAQKVASYAELRDKYSNESAVFVSRKQDATFKMEKNVPVVYNDNYEELMLLNDKDAGYMEQSIYWSAFSDIKDLDARALVPEGNKYKTIKVTEFTRTNEFAEGTFFDDARAYRFTYPGLKSGARTIYSYTEKVKDPYLYGRFYFRSYAPVDEEEYSVTFPPEIKIKYKVMNGKPGDLEFTAEKHGKNTTYIWKAHNMARIKSESGMPGIGYYIPHIVVLLDSYTVNGETHKVMTDPASLYQWNYKMVKEVAGESSPRIKEITDSLTRGIADTLEKVQRIYYWVQKNINYVAIEDSMGGFVPRDAALVCNRRYGDCKDMANCLCSMLTEAGITAYRTWIGTRDIPYSFYDIPSPMSTNHMICTVFYKGKYYFLDATGKYAPYDFYTSMIQGKEALIGMGEGKFRIDTIPEMTAGQNTSTDITRIEMDNTLIRGSGTVTNTGYGKINLCTKLMNYENKERQNIVNGYLQKGNNKFKVDSVSYENLDDNSKPLVIHYGFELPTYAQKNGNEIYVNMNLNKNFAGELIEPGREAPKELEYKSMNREVCILNIPSGYRVTYLPKEYRYECPEFSFSIHCTKQDNRVINDCTIAINTLLINPAQFGQWNDMIHELAKAYNETVALAK